MIKEIISMDKQIQIKLTILDVLVEEERWIDTDELSHKLELLPRTTLKYISSLQDDITLLKNPDIQILSVKNKGFRLILDSRDHFRSISTVVIQNSLTSELIDAIFFDTFHSTASFALTHFTSEYSVRKQINKWKDIIQGKSLAFNSLNHLVGKEIEVRFLGYMFFWQVYNIYKWPYPQVDEQELRRLVDGFLDKSGVNLTYMQKEQLIQVTGFNIMRAAKKKPVQIEPLWDSYLQGNKMYDMYLVQINEIKQQYSLSTNELKYMFLLSLTRPLFFYPNNFKKYILQFHADKNTEIHQAIQLFMEDFPKAFRPIIPSKFENFRDELFSAFIYCSLVEGFKVDYSGYPYLYNIKIQFPNLYYKLDVFIDTLYKKTRYKFFLQKEYLINKFASLFSELDMLNVYEDPIGIFFDSDLPYYIEKEFKKKIVSLYSIDYKIVFVEHRMDLLAHNKRGIIAISQFKQLEDFALTHQISIQHIHYPLSNADLKYLTSFLAFIQ